MKKTPMKELIEKFRELQQMSQDNAGFLFSMWLTECEESLLEKEKEMMCQFAFDYSDELYNNGEVPPVKEYYNETFNTKEK
jgi:hypothetical protein